SSVTPYPSRPIRHALSVTNYPSLLTRHAATHLTAAAGSPVRTDQRGRTRAAGQARCVGPRDPRRQKAGKARARHLAPAARGRGRSGVCARERLAARRGATARARARREGHAGRARRSARSQRDTRPPAGAEAARPAARGTAAGPPLVTRLGRAV